MGNNKIEAVCHKSVKGVGVTAKRGVKSGSDGASTRERHRIDVRRRDPTNRGSCEAVLRS
jgi:hypothetical protein